MKNFNQRGAIDMLFVLALVVVLGVGALVFVRISSSDDSEQGDASVESENVSVFTDGLGQEQTISSFAECMDWVMPWEEKDGQVICMAPNDVNFSVPCEEATEHTICKSETVISDSGADEYSEGRKSEFVVSSETGERKTVVIDALGVQFSSVLNSEIVITEIDGYQYLTTQRFIDYAISRDDYQAGLTNRCELDIAAISVFDTSDDVKKGLMPYFYEQNFSSEGEYIGDGETIVELSDGRFAFPQKQAQAVCYDPVHLDEAEQILLQMDDLQPIL